MYRPAEAAQMVTMMEIIGVEEIKSQGVVIKHDVPIGRIFCSFKTYGGTERDVNGITVVEDTANIVTWYRPDITSACRLKRVEDGAVFEILGEPEDIELRHQILKIKVRRLKGGA